MIKKALLLTFSGFFMLTGSVLTASDTQNCICREPTTTEVVMVWVALGDAAIFGGLAIPYVLSVATAAAPYVVPTTTVGKVGLGLKVAQTARPYVLPTTEEKLNALLKEKASRPVKANTEFINCLKANRYKYPRNKSGIPVVCEEAALFYAIDSTVPALNKKTEAFKNGKCFCL